MGIVRVLPCVEDWLNAEAESWSPLPDRDYVELVRRWREGFLPLIAAGTASFTGNRAMQVIAERLPADVWLFSGVQVPKLANTGGLGAAGYHATGLRNMRRELANQLELIAAVSNLSWSCVFSHEAGAFVWECLYELSPQVKIVA
ncbi:MAG: hypothetical protein K8T91_28115 [Planctomycetes bacterium]|nr:hypothetical protein [Planctomycetota bacterium]